jgi:phosphoribosylamine--glycine ligase
MIALIIGSGGREHALAWKIAQASNVKKVYVAPGNGGTACESNKIENISLSDFNDLIEFAKNNAVDLTIVGPELPLSQGIVDLFKEHNLKIFGPSKQAAQLESSKDFAKSFMNKHGIPTANYETFTDITLAHKYIEKNGAPIVIKADGLAAGKGVIIALTEEEAYQAIDSMLSQNKFGDAGARVVIEEFLDGEEASFIAICDGENVLPLASSQDHKRLQDNDNGPNTGGMGAYSPAPIVTKEIHEKIMNQIILPTMKGMKEDGIKFQGFLYAGVIIDKNNNIKTLEFNCRMGDPETQPILFRLRSNLFNILMAAESGDLSNTKAEWDDGYAITIVMAAHNYPNKPRIGDQIYNLDNDVNDCYTFHAGTKKIGEKIYTSGGRVLGITARAKSLDAAKDKVYKLTSSIEFSGAQYRNDIGQKALIKSSEK